MAVTASIGAGVVTTDAVTAVAVTVGAAATGTGWISDAFAEEKQMSSAIIMKQQQKSKCNIRIILLPCIFFYLP
jgi:hypothetical protein